VLGKTELEFTIALLDSETNAVDFNFIMKSYLSLLPMLIITNVAFAQVTQTPEVQPTTDKTVITQAQTIASCQLATQQLGNNVMRENYLYALDKMYPRYRKRQETLHGAPQFKKVFLDMANTLNNLGVTITSFKAEKPVSFFRVWPQIKPGAKLKIERGEQKDVIAGDVVYNLLVMVPTTQTWTFRSNKGGPPRVLKREGFQVAIAQETEIPGQEQWSFIDGDSLQPQELRSMFPSLTQNLVLPKRLDTEVK